MFELNTNRLKIIPLNIQQLELLKDDMEAFEKSIGLNLSDHEKFDEKTEKDIKNAWKFWIEGVKKNPFNYTWFTRWEIILKSENKIIGSCGFKGFPNNKGEVEIGYMIKPSYQNKGYMTEALKEMVRFSFMHHRVNHVLAETPQDNFPSHRVLIKNDFEIFKEKENNFWWKHSKYGKN
jgi:RimJ/RimL family protein N-acetyltransferase